MSAAVMDKHKLGSMNRDAQVMRRPFAVIAEDDDDIRLGLVEFFRSEGFRVGYVSDGELLVRYLDWCDRCYEYPDVVVVDHRMPGYSGLEVLEGMREAGWDVPVIMITAFGPEVRPHAQALGAQAVFDKPFDPDELRHAVLTVVEWQHRAI